MTAIAAAIGGCASRSAGVRPRRRFVTLVPVDVSWDRVIRTTTGLRPHRDSGFVVRAERLDEKTVIHNFGHGGAGMSLSWGTAHLAADLAVEHTERRAEVIGCGIVGLTSARMLQRRGFDVTIYAAALPPDTTSNMSLASFTPTSGLVSDDRRTPAWDDQFRRAVAIAYREHQLLVGPRYGVSWIDEYSLTDSPAGGRGGRGFGGGAGVDAGRGREGGGLLPASVNLGREVLEPGEHPFGTRYARRAPTMRFEPSIYLDALMRDVITFGGRIQVRAFDAPGDLASVSEPLIVNCTGLGAKRLFGDDELVPVKGQLTVLVPQVEVTYSLGTMLPRSDGIVLGHVMERGNWSLEVNEEERQRVMEHHLRIFGAMRVPDPGARLTVVGAPAEVPPVESFFDRVS